MNTHHYPFILLYGLHFLRLQHDSIFIKFVEFILHVTSGINRMFLTNFSQYTSQKMKIFYDRFRKICVLIFFQYLCLLFFIIFQADVFCATFWGFYLPFELAWHSFIQKHFANTFHHQLFFGKRSLIFWEFQVNNLSWLHV